MAYTNQNRRKFERFDISTPARIETGGNCVTELQTKDISAGGAFFYTQSPHKKGSVLHIEIIIPNETISNLNDVQFQLKVKGRVVRCEEGGIAVKFSGQEILPIGSTMDN